MFCIFECWKIEYLHGLSQLLLKWKPWMEKKNETEISRQLNWITKESYDDFIYV